MSLLRDIIMPTLGLPQPAIAPSRRLNMTQDNFYTKQIQNPQQSQQLGPTGGLDQTQQTSTSQPIFNAPPEQSFEQSPVTGDYIKQQLASYAQRKAVPQLNPGERVTSPDSSLVQPETFQQYYDQLSNINQAGQEMLAATQARSAFQRQKELDAVKNQQIQAFAGAILNNSGSGGNAYGNGVPSNPKANFTYAQQIAPQFGWNDPGELSAWYQIGMNESGWNNNAQNPTSTAYGIGQFLDSTWAGVGGSKTSDPRLQVQYMAQYIKNRYGSPSRALAFWNAHHWY